MPPKKKKSAADKAREEEEARRLAEEEARLDALRRQREREFQEEQEREQISNALAGQAERFQEEKDKLNRLLENRQSEMILVEDRMSRESEWDKYIACSRLPEMSIERDINTYLNLWAEESITEEGEASIAALQNQLPEAEELAAQLESHIAAAIDKADSKEEQRLDAHLQRLRRIIQDKWDALCSHILQHVDSFNREQNENFQLASQTRDYFVGLWGNLTRNPRYKSIEFNFANLSCTLPKPIALAPVAIRMLYETGTTASALFRDTSSQLKMNVVGGILYLDLMEMPELPRVVDKWTVRPVLANSTSLSRLKYPFRKTGPDDEVQENAQADINTDAQFVTQITYNIVPYSFIHRESAKVMFWDEETGRWSDDRITDIQIEKETGNVQFRTVSFKPTAVLQYAFSEFPLADWYLRPVDKNKAILTIRGKDNEIILRISESGVQLLSPQTEYLELNVKQHKLNPSTLFKKLGFVGLNFVAPRDLKGWQIDDFVVKNPSLEEQVSTDLSLLANAFEFKKSPSNLILGANQSAIIFREYLPNRPDGEDHVGWKTFVFDALYQAKDKTEYSLAWVPDSEIISREIKLPTDADTLHANIFNLLTPMITNEENTQRVENTSSLFSKTILQVFRATRLVSFS